MIINYTNLTYSINLKMKPTASVTTTFFKDHLKEKITKICSNRTVRQVLNIASIHMCMWENPNGLFYNNDHAY